MLKNMASIKDQMDFWTPELDWVPSSYRKCWAGAGFPRWEEVSVGGQSRQSHMMSVVHPFSRRRSRCRVMCARPLKLSSHGLESRGRPWLKLVELPPHWRRPKEWGYSLTPSPARKSPLGNPNRHWGSSPITGDFSPFLLILSGHSSPPFLPAIDPIHPVE